LLNNLLLTGVNMSNTNISRYLYVFNHIISHGEKDQDRYYFGDLTAWHDIDGYTCYIGYKDLTMTLFFHSRFSFEYEEDSTMQAFSKLVENSEAEFAKK